MFIKPETKTKLKNAWIEQSAFIAVAGSTALAITLTYIKYAGDTTKAQIDLYENKTRLDNQAYDVWLAQQPNTDSSATE